jgi:hypothetical protein
VAIDQVVGWEPRRKTNDEPRDGADAVIGSNCRRSPADVDTGKERSEQAVTALNQIRSYHQDPDICLGSLLSARLRIITPKLNVVN